ncbi:hypothetical protein BN11_1690003 [Nostocoides australiense Ben110]|uniref:Uncharacterized protein n=1 Tax=Nostocoides australiense Ben110 TaxID=1193182 RepID=W6K2A1_9MICO|nr:hypothetical protein BN11_1690003 [Tetrasphaera australiensis Ben110]
MFEVNDEDEADDFEPPDLIRKALRLGRVSQLATHRHRDARPAA